MFEDEKFQKAMQFIEFFEENFTCSGICSYALFYYTLPMADGPPSTTCLSHMKSVIEDNLTFFGMACVTCGVIMFITWLCQYLLWKKYDE